MPDLELTFKTTCTKKEFFGNVVVLWQCGSSLAMWKFWELFYVGTYKL